MAPELLQIKQLSSTGELLGVVSCHAGQISVFRAASTTDLAPYLRALVGISGQERFSISLDDAAFRPAEHNLIGFGERFASGAEVQTPQQMLLAAGAPESAISAALSSVGLEAVMTRPCSSLNACEERRLRILAATFQPAKVLVLNDPFDPISSQWKERFAESLSSFARTKNALVVVPFLSNRPESWIDNERVARIQVGQSVQKTIGFGSGPSQIRGVIDQIRSEQSNEDLETPVVEEESLSRPSQLDEEPEGKKRGAKTSAPLVIGAFLFLVALGVGAGIFLLPKPSSESTEVALINQGEDGAQSADSSFSVATTSEAALNQSAASAEALPEEPSPSPIPEATQEPRVARLLDLYPAAIRDSVIESFEGVITTQADLAVQNSPRLSRDQAASQVVKRPASGNTSELLTVLESTSSETTTEPEVAPQNNPSDAELESMSSEQRREVIRQRFLEAIQRAARPQ